MSRIILVTGPDLAPSAAQLVSERGFETVHTPPYADSSVISGLLRETEAVGIVSRMGRIDAEVMDAAPQLRVISKHGAGVDNIDLAAAADRGIPVLVAPGANAVSVAEHTVALIFAVVKRLLPLDNGLRAGRWEKPGYLGRELAGSTVALLGMGAIARATARMLRNFDMILTGYDPFATDATFAELGIRRAGTAEELFAGADVLSLHCPLNDQTREIVNAERIGLMPEGSYVINTARGGLIDEAALLDAVQSGHLAGAGLDTFAIEPPSPDHPFFAEPRILLTPHIGGVTREAGIRVGEAAVNGIFQVLDGKPVAPERIANNALLATAAASSAR
jgi:D-3-phosphoglycerate dehydrogenase